MRKIEMSPEITVEYSAKDDALFVSFSYNDSEDDSVFILPVPVAIWLTKAIEAEILTAQSSAIAIRAPHLEVKKK